jgi:hypothetical protein
MAAGFRVLPADIKAQIDAIGDSEFVFGTARTYSAAWHSAVIDRLQLRDAGDSEFRGLPGTAVGRWSRWNVTGWIKVWRDRPKIPQTFTHQVPNYRGDGWHDISQTRQVFQKSRWFGEQIEAVLTRDRDTTDMSTGIVQKKLRGPYDDSQYESYRYAASLSREWFGEARVFKIGEDGIPDIPLETLLWEPLPPGTADEIREFISQKTRANLLPRDLEIMIDRLAKVESLKPQRQWWGSSGMQRYVGYEFGPDFVAFENPFVGNALYVLRGNWQELSQLSRTELMANREGEFDRIIHSARWFDRLRILVYDYRRG